MGLGKGGETVRSATLDSYNLTGVSLIKIDVQGAEQLVVYGARVRALPHHTTRFSCSWLDFYNNLM